VDPDSDRVCRGPVVPLPENTPIEELAKLVYEIRPRKDKRGVDLISDALPLGRLWYTKPDDAIEYAKFRSRSYDAVIRVYDDAGT
jgi:hypothetical protein